MAGHRELSVPHLTYPPDILETALELAVHLHRQQRDKMGGPYIMHPLRVMHKVAKYENDAMTCAAVLHDVVEDTVMSLEGLGMYLPLEVVAIVDFLTRRENQGYQQFIERCAGMPEAALVKLADLSDNLWHPARRKGWDDPRIQPLKERYLKAYFYLKDDKPY